MTRPYKDKKINKDKFIRTFDENVNPIELLWHVDLRGRIITILESDNWELQMDEKLPRILSEGDKLYIPEHTYHRLIKGKGTLKILIQEI